LSTLTNLPAILLGHPFSIIEKRGWETNNYFDPASLGSSRVELPAVARLFIDFADIRFEGAKKWGSPSGILVPAGNPHLFV
jgi:hypothetical protein